MKIRGKLLILIMIPLVALFAAVGWGFGTQSSRTEAAEEALSVAEDVDAVRAAMLAIGDERLFLLAGQGDLAEIQAATDAALAAVPEERFPTAKATAISDVAAARSATDPQDAFDFYGAAFDDFRDSDAITADDLLTSAQFGGAAVADDAIEMINARDIAWAEYLSVDVAEPNALVELAEAFTAAETRHEDLEATLALVNNLDSLETAINSAANIRINELAAIAQSEIESGEFALERDEILDSLVTSQLTWDTAVLDADAEVISWVQDDLDSANGIRSLFTLLGLLGVVVLGGLVFVIYRSITLPLGSLLNRAQSVADDELPELIRVLRHSDSVAELPAPSVIPVTSSDEIGDLVSAFNDVQVAAYDLATEQALGRRNVGDMFINLGRRNQQLLQRILNQLTELEREEENPETLDTLFALDNIVTRMRRNAESLLVLAGGQTARQWSNPVSLEDTVRSALSEVENYQRVDIAALAEVHLPGSMVADVAHLLAELIENAVNFSDPNTQVLVGGHFENENYVVTIFDQGIGMSDDELETNNRRITDPPPLDQAPTRFLGLFVVGRLADRHNVSVRLAKAPGRGLMARVQIPAQHLLLDRHGSDLPGDAEQLSAAAAFIDDELAELSGAYQQEALPAGDASVEADEIDADLAERSFEVPVIDGDGSVFAESDAPPVEIEQFDLPTADTPVAPEIAVDDTLPDLPMRGGGTLRVDTPSAAPTADTPVAEPPVPESAPAGTPTNPMTPMPPMTHVAEAPTPGQVANDVPANAVGEALTATQPTGPVGVPPLPANDGLPTRVRGAALDGAPAPANTDAQRATTSDAPAADGKQAGNFSSMMSAFSSGVRRGIEDNAFESLDEGLDQ